MENNEFWEMHRRHEEEYEAMRKDYKEQINDLYWQCRFWHSVAVSSIVLLVPLIVSVVLVFIFR